MNDSAERRRRVSALFDAALDLPASQRAALLADACADDPALRAEVERLLAADATLDLAACIDRDVAGTADDVADTVATAADRQLGAWQLTTLLGRGGMGEVFAAHRVDDPRHRAAIKYVRRRWDGSVESLRFAEERRILARLSHPAIPSLIDHGVDEEGRPWFALDYVDGKDLLSHADSRQLGLSQRIDLFRAVCSAVQHAHQHFVVHRDLKPGNILVDQDGHPKVLDFGVAKQLDQDVSQTRTGNVAGFTPAYAAPEQINDGPITAATDVYTLGVVLYQLLTGRLPYVAAASGLHATAEAITRNEPERLDRALTSGGQDEINARLQARQTSVDAFRRFVRGDLSRIVQTALAKEPERRYASVSALSDDLGRLLAGRPVSVMGNTLGYRLRKFVARNRWAVALGSVAVVAILAGTVSSVLQMRKAHAAAADARAQRDAAMAEADRSQALRDYLLLLFRESEGEAAERSARDLLATSADRVFASYQTDPAAGMDVATSLGEIYSSLSDLNAAGAIYRAVLAHPQIGQFPDYRAKAELGLADTLMNEGKQDQARELLGKAQAFWQTDPVRWQEPLLDSRGLQARLERDAGNGEAAIATLRAAQQQAFAANGGKHSRTSLSYLVTLSSTLVYTGDAAGGREVAKEALDGYRALGQVETVEGIGALNNLAFAHILTGDVAAAAELGAEAWALRKRLYPKSANTVVVGINHAFMVAQLGRLDEARQISEQVLQMAVDNIGVDSRQAMSARVLLIEIEIKAGQAAAAMALLNQQQLHTPKLQLSPLEQAANLRQSGIVYMANGQSARARQDLQAAEKMLLDIGPGGAEQLKAVRVWMEKLP